jgi:hypothetical protein
VDTTIVKAPDVTNGNIGLVFWLVDWKNYYYAWYWADGDVEIGKIVNDRRVTLPFFKPPALKKGIGETNQIELLLKEKEGTLFINGTEVKRFKGKQPNEDNWIGVVAASRDEKPGLFKFDNFVMNAVPTESSASRSGPAGTALSQAANRPSLATKPDTLRGQ